MVSSVLPHKRSLLCLPVLGKCESWAAGIRYGRDEIGERRVEWVVEDGWGIVGCESRVNGREVG